MLSVSQAWKDEQTKQIRSEANVRIIFENGVVIDKNVLRNFSYTQKGSITNRCLVSYSCEFDVFAKDNYIFNVHDFCRLEFGFLINGHWEWAYVGSFQVFDRKLPQNGLIYHYSLNNAVLRDGTNLLYLNSIYKGGSNKDYEGNDMTIERLSNALYSSLLPSQFNAPCGKTLEPCSYYELGQQIASAVGYTFNIGRISNSDTSFNIYCKWNIVPYSVDNVNYEITPELSYKYPEFIIEENIYGVNLNVYHNEVKIEQGDVVRKTKTFGVILDNLDYFQEGQRGVPNTGYYAWHSVEGIDPTEYWGIVDTAGDVAGHISNNEFFIFAQGEERLGGSGQFVVAFMDTTFTTKSYNISNYGSFVEYDNHLVNEAYKDNCSSLLTRWLKHNILIDCDFRIDPRLELFDTVKVIDKDGIEHYGVVEYVKIEFNGNFKGKMEARQFAKTISAPILIQKTITDEYNYMFKVANNNDEKLTLHIKYSGRGEITRTINANSFDYLNYGNASELQLSVDSYLRYDLYDDVWCYFENESGLISDSIVLLEANAW